jgi:hypothetical protein
MEVVYLLWHSHPTGEGEDNEKLIRIYPTEDEAKAAQNRISGKPGFGDLSRGL